MQCRIIKYKISINILRIELMIYHISSKKNAQPGFLCHILLAPFDNSKSVIFWFFSDKVTTVPSQARIH